MNKNVLFFAGAFSALVFAGCKTPPPEPVMVEVRVPTVNTYSSNGKRIVTDEILNASLSFVDARMTKTNDGYAKCTFFVKNIGRRQLKLVTRVNWFDADGTPVSGGDEGSWKTQHLAGGDDLSLTFLAPTKACVEAKLDAKEVE